MVEVIPALMARDLPELNRYLEEFAALVDTVQLDVMDGVYVPPKSFPYNDLEEFGEFEKGNLDFSVDLMIRNPADVVEDWIRAGAKRVIVHVEGLKGFSQIEKIARGNSVELAVAIGTTTNIEGVSEYIEKSDSIQCMGIETIGYQGAKFDERVLSQIVNLRKHYPSHIISIDGGVNLETAPSLIAAGATRLVAGSAILNSDNRKEMIDRLANSG